MPEIPKTPDKLAEMRALPDNVAVFRDPDGNRVELLSDDLILWKILAHPKNLTYLYTLYEPRHFGFYDHVNDEHRSFLDPQLMSKEQLASLRLGI